MRLINIQVIGNKMPEILFALHENSTNIATVKSKQKGQGYE